MGIVNAAANAVAGAISQAKVRGSFGARTRASAQGFGSAVGSLVKPLDQANEPQGFANARAGAGAGPLHRAQWLRHVTNGDFAEPPPDPTKPINSDPTSAAYNPLPGWELVDLSSGRITLFWGTTTASGSGGAITFHGTGTISGDRAYLRQPVAIRSTVSRNTAVLPLVSAAAFIAGTPQADVTLKANEWDIANGVLGTLVDLTSLYGNGLGALDLYTTAIAALRAATAALDLQVGAGRISGSAIATWRITMYEIALVDGEPFVVIPDLATPQNAAIVLRNSNGQLVGTSLGRVFAFFSS